MPIQVPEFSPFVKRVAFEPVIPSLTVGAFAGGTGLLFGGFAGIAFSNFPIFFATVTGAQCFVLGSSFFYCRSALIAGIVKGTPSRREELRYSTVAGAAAGAFTGSLRSRSNVLPGAIFMGLMGFVGQKSFYGIPAIYNPNTERQPMMKRIMDSPWMPLKSISDDEYEEMLKEKLIKADAEIALIDERLLALRSTNVDATPTQNASEELP